MKYNVLTEYEWQELVARVRAADFWKLPSRDDAPACMDGDVWTIEGFRDGDYHLVRRHTGSVLDGTGEAVYRFGQQLLHLAEIGVH